MMSLLVPDCRTVREIAQQPALWREVEGIARESRSAFQERVDGLLAAPGARIVLTGAGSSGFIGRMLAPLLAERLRRRVDALPTTDLVSAPRSVLAEDLPTLLVSFARSGDSPESVAATELADALLSRRAHLIVTCAAEGALARRHGERDDSFVCVMPPAANDRGFAMTSSFTTMLLAARALLGGGGDVSAATLADAAEAVLEALPAAAKALASRGFTRIVALGSGALRGLADEAALKVLELTAGRVMALSDSPLGFRHGPKSMLHGQTLAVVFVSNAPLTRRYDFDMVHELRAALPAGQVIAVASGAEEIEGESVWRLPGLERADDAGFGAVALLCAQLIGLHFSVALGCTPDDPFPAGEVNRVVKGVTIHRLAR